MRFTLEVSIDIFIFSCYIYFKSMTSSEIGDLVARCTAFSPGHITGFFEKPKNKNQNTDPLFYGSKGAGFSFKKGVTTSVELYNSKKKSYHIYINNLLTNNAEVSEWVTQYYLDKSDFSYYIKINHSIDIPIGYGLGTSGAAALSLSYALNKALDIKFLKEQAAQIAHIAEISCNTGLGTVIAEFYGGLEIRTSFGAPGIGKVTKIELNNYKAIILCIGPLSTKQILSNYSNNANILGQKMVEQLLLSKDVNSFLRMSHEFANFLGLTKGLCAKPIEELNNFGVECSTGMFGETIFTLVSPSEIYPVISMLKKYPGTLIVSDIDNRGALIENFE
jgi:pantoate kinase